MQAPYAHQAAARVHVQQPASPARPSIPFHLASPLITHTQRCGARNASIDRCEGQRLISCRCRRRCHALQDLGRGRQAAHEVRLRLQSGRGLPGLLLLQQTQVDRQLLLAAGGSARGIRSRLRAGGRGRRTALAARGGRAAAAVGGALLCVSPLLPLLPLLLLGGRRLAACSIWCSRRGRLACQLDSLCQAGNQVGWRRILALQAG